MVKAELVLYSEDTRLERVLLSCTFHKMVACDSPFSGDLAHRISNILVRCLLFCYFLIVLHPGHPYFLISFVDVKV